MTSHHEAELRALNSDEVPRRLEAARYLEKAARHGDEALLKNHLQTEPDELVARVLRRALARAEGRRGGNAIEARPAAEELLVRERSRAIRDATGMFLHEMRPLVGDVELVASQLDSDYQAGPLFASIERLRETLAAFEDLRSAADSEQLSEFDLTSLVSAVVREESERARSTELSAASQGSEEHDPEGRFRDRGSAPFRIMATLARQDPVVTSGTPGLLRLVLKNAVRNAIEACETVIASRPGRVVISWGATDQDGWVSVVDDGPGIHPSLGSPWEVGASTKGAAEHGGLGLVIVDQAVDSMRGRVELVDGEVGGCRFEVRWPIGKGATAADPAS